jgi:hypothetical protein
MEHYNLNNVIHIKCEKKMQNKPSKGRRQWEFLEKFDGKTLGSFFEAAEAKTRTSPAGSFQEGSWWKRETDWNIQRNNIVIYKSK